MIPVLIAGLLAGALLAQAAPTASPSPCSAGDISVTGLHIKIIKGNKRTATADRVLITGDFTNVGLRSQEPHTAQHAELVRNGAVVAQQPLPALANGVTYPLQFRIFRDTSRSTDPIGVLVRYVLDDKTQVARNNCSAINDSMSKTF